MNIIGIDPGLSGGVAVIPLYDFYRTQTYSLADYTLSQLSGILQEFRGGGGILYEQEKDTHCEVYIDNPLGAERVEVYLEEPQLPMLNTNNNNNFSVQAHKKLARSLGQLEGICTGAGYPPNLVSPPKWQNALKCRTGGDKNITKNLAMRVFPFLSRTCKSGPNKGLPISTITHATADALLIALYGYLQYQKPERIPLTVKQNIDTLSIPKKKPEPSQEIVLLTSENELLGRYTGPIRRKAPSRPQTYPLASIKEPNDGSDQRPIISDGHGLNGSNPRPRRSR